MNRNLPALVKALSANGLKDAAQAIMTTDTFPKMAIRRERINGEQITIAGMAKGAGMIAPQMATMLSFVADRCGDLSGSVAQIHKRGGR